MKGYNHMVDRRIAILDAVERSGYAAAGRQFGVNPGVLWYLVNKGTEPKDTTIRARLGLPATALVQGMDGVAVRPLAVVQDEARPCSCGCGAWFIPAAHNQSRIRGHPRRRVYTRSRRAT